MKIEQVEPYETWPSGDSRPLAVLNVTTAELEQQNGLRFAGELDDELGDYLFAAVEPTPGHQFWLLKYADDPSDGIQVYADSAESPDSLHELLDGLELSADSVEWSAQSSPRAPSWVSVFGELEAQGWVVEDRGAFIHVELASGRFRVRIADDLDEDSLLNLPKSLRQLGNLAELRPEPA